MSLERHVNRLTLGLAGLALAANLSCEVRPHIETKAEPQPSQTYAKVTPEDVKKYTDRLGLPEPSQEEIDKIYADPEMSKKLQEADEYGAEYGSILNRIMKAKVIDVQYGKPFDPNDVLRFYLGESSSSDSERVFDAYRTDFKYLNPGLKQGMKVDYLKIRDLNNNGREDYSN